MNRSISRRRFLTGAGSAAGAALLAPSGIALSADVQQRAVGDRAWLAEGPAAIASENGLQSVETAVRLMHERTDPLDAAIEGVVPVEEDAEETSVGYGGLPNAEGVVQLDASVMHGPSHHAGAVAALENITTPSRVARLVMERTDHVLLVGAGALQFARDHGFEESDLLTDRARRLWLHWRATLSDDDDLFPDPQADEELAAALAEARVHQGTIHCAAKTAAGDFGAVTTTSGLAFKLPGRVGDSPLVGHGLYVENEVGSCGSTGRGEAVILSCGSFAVVELMRGGASPAEACLEVLRRIARQAQIYGLADDAGRPTFQVNFYALAKDGRYAGAALLAGARFSICDARGPRHEESLALFE